MIVGAARGVRLLEKLAERCLALKGPLEQQEHALYGKGVRNGPSVIVGQSKWVHVALQGDANAFIDWLSDAGGLPSLRPSKAAK